MRTVPTSADRGLSWRKGEPPPDGWGQREGIRPFDAMRERRVAMNQDPVCGMQVDPGKAAGHTQHQGKTYYFCSAGCKRKFEENPGRYAI